MKRPQTAKAAKAPKAPEKPDKLKKRAKVGTRHILLSAAALVLVAAFVAWQFDLFATVDDKGNCADVVLTIAKDPRHAAAVCLRQAKEGDAYAQTAVGKMYADGRGVAEDFDQAKFWFEKAVLQKQPEALYNLGLLYANGDGVEQSWPEAVRWYRLAAERGQVDAENSLGVRYKKGEGVDQDYVQAYKWFLISLSNATKPAEQAMAIANRDALAKLMTPEQIADAQNKAKAWKPVSP
jgi:Sel1 repeat-containing protein